MFEFVRFAIRNPSYVTRGARRAWATRKAMAAYRALPASQECAYCGRSKKLEVHHIEPVSVSPGKAAEPDNYLMLCRKPPCHQVIGHNGDFGGRYVANVREVCATRQAVAVRTKE